MPRQSTNQPQQRAKISRRRRRRGPPEQQHGARSQSGIKIRSVAAWNAYLAYKKIQRAEQRRLETERAAWRARATEKAAS